MAEILKWSFLGLGALFVLVPICYYWFLKIPIVNKHIADSAAATAKDIDVVLQKQIYSNSIPVLFLFVILLYLISWKLALIFLLGALFSVTVRTLVAYFSKKINPIQLLEIEKSEEGKSSDILKVMTSIFVFGFAFLALFSFKLIFNDINVLYALVLGVGLETFLAQIQSIKLPYQNSICSNYFFIFSFSLIVLATIAERFYPSFSNLALLLWVIPVAGLKIFLLSILITFLLKKIIGLGWSEPRRKKLKLGETVLPVSVAILSAISFYLIPLFLYKNDQVSVMRIFLSLLLGLVVAMIFHFIPKKSEEQNIQNFVPILSLVFSLLLANYLAGYLGIVLVITAQISLFWIMLSKDSNHEYIHQNILANVFGLGAILMFFLIQKVFQASIKNDEISLVASLLLGGFIPYFIVHYSLLSSDNTYKNLFALISILAPLAIISLFGSVYLIGILIGVLVVGILLSFVYQKSKFLLYAVISIILLLVVLLKDFLQTDLNLTFKIIIAGVSLISISAFAIFKPEENE